MPDNNDIYKDINISNEDIAKIEKRRKALEDKKRSSKGMSKKEAQKYFKEQEKLARLEYLESKRVAGKETLGQRLELEARKKLGKTPQVLKATTVGIGHVGKFATGVVGGAAGLAAGTISGVTSSKAASNLVKDIMYSNPITAILYENQDLLKTVGKGIKGVGKLGLKAAGGMLGLAGKGIGWGANALYQSLRGKGKEETGTGLISSGAGAITGAKQKLISGGGYNLIMAKNAIFMGGKNAVIVGAGGGQMGVFAAAQDQLQGTPKLRGGIAGLLPDSKKSLGFNKDDPNIIQITKGIKGQYEQTKESNKLLKKMDKKTALIVAGLLVGVAAIVGIGMLLKKLGFIHQTNPKIDPTTQTAEYSKLKDSDKTTNLTDIQKAIQNRAKVESITAIKKQPHVGPWALDTPITSGYTLKTKEGSPYYAPFDMKVIQWKINEKKKGAINLIVNKKTSNGGYELKRKEILDVFNCKVVPGDIVNKGQIIGVVGPDGNINVRDISEDEAKDYADLINKKASRDGDLLYRNFSSNFDVLQSTKISDAYATAEAQSFKRGEEGSGSIKGALDRVIDEKDIQKYTKNNAEQLNYKDMPEMFKDTQLTKKSGFWNNLQEQYAKNKYEQNKNEQNKNVTNAVQNAQKGQVTGFAADITKQNFDGSFFDNTPKTIAVPEKDKVAMLMFSPVDGSDLARQQNSSFDVC